MDKFLWRTYDATLLPPQPEGEPPQLADVLNVAEDDGWEVFSIFSPKPVRAVVICRRPLSTPVAKPTTPRAKK